MKPRTTLYRAAASLGLLLLSAGPMDAQQLAGVALDPDGEPLTDVTVILHRVGAGGGAMAGTDTTGAAGDFVFDLPARDSAVYFAALRYQGDIYVGPAIEAGGEPVTGYVLQVGPTSSVAAMGAAMGGGPPSSPTPARPAQVTRTNSDTGALALVTLLALAAAGLFVFTAPRYREHRTREAVIRIAEIENRLAKEADALPKAERERLQERRDRLREQLAPQG